MLRGVWDLPRPGLEPVSPALAGRFSTTAPPGSPSSLLFNAKKNKLYFLLCILTRTSRSRQLSTLLAQGTAAAPSGALCDGLWPDAVKPLPRVELCSVDGLYFELHHTALSLNYYFADVFRDEQEAEGVSQG